MEVIILGGDGMLGWHLSEILWDMSTPLKGREINILDPSSIKNHITDKTRWIINCMGVIPHRKTSLAEMIHVNSVWPQLLYFYLKEKFPNIRLLHITTDCVFDSSDEGRLFKEDDPLSDTASNYGVTKWCGEPGGCQTIRTSIIGEERRNFLGLVEKIKSSTGHMDGWVNHFWNGVTCVTLAGIILNIILKNITWSGTRHIFSQDSVTKFELVRSIADFYNRDLSINPVFHTPTVNRKLETVYEPFLVQPIRAQISEMWTWGQNRFNRSKPTNNNGK